MAENGVRFFWFFMVAFPGFLHSGKWSRCFMEGFPFSGFLAWLDTEFQRFFDAMAFSGFLHGWIWSMVFTSHQPFRHAVDSGLLHGTITCVTLMCTTNYQELASRLSFSQFLFFTYLFLYTPPPSPFQSTFHLFPFMSFHLRPSG